VDDRPIVGRAVELAAIVERLEREQPEAIVIGGAAGVGKSRLLRVVGAWAAGRGWSVSPIVGTSTAATIPFGAVVSLLTGLAEDSPALDVIAHAKRALAANDADPPQLLVVDDAQRLDAGSAMLVAQVVEDRLCRVVATVRSGEPAPETIADLWTAGLADRIELAGLSLSETGELLTGLLGGPVDTVAARRLWETTDGNALYLREIVADALGRDAVRRERGSWRLTGPTPVPPRLVELIEMRLATLDDSARSALDVLAVAERIDLEELPGLVERDAVERLEEADLIEFASEGAGSSVTLAHPLYGEAVRNAMSVVRRRKVLRNIAEAVEAAGMKRPGDLVRVATWRLDAGATVDVDLLTAAARHAYNGNDFGLSERLALAARRAGAGVAAGLVLAETQMITGRHEDAAVLLRELAAEASTDRERVDVADDRAITLGLLLGREDEAVAVVNETLVLVDDPELVDPLRASLAIVLVQIPRPAAAIQAARPLLDRPDDPVFYRGAYAASMALAISGSLAEAIELGWRGHEAHAAVGTALRFLPEAQFIGLVYALCGAGRLDDAARLAGQGFEAAVAAHDADLQAGFALLNGLVAVLHGRLVTARRHFEEAAALNRPRNDLASLRWALGGIALAAGMSSDPRGSDEAVAELTTLALHPVQLHEAGLVARGRGWALAASGARTAAVETLRNGADRAGESGLLVDEAMLRHDLVRLGLARAERDRLVDLAGRIDGELVPALVGHADAVLAGAGRPLEDAARRFAELDVDLVAAEAALGAAEAYRRQGLRRRAAECSELAHHLIENCEGVRSPATRREPAFAALTNREREIATLAARGLTSRDIAEQLSLSTRTVDNHLQNAFGKLGVTGRHELDAVLGQKGGRPPVS
jgi:DNA-binding CsgD family transcriptional regulator